MMTQCALLASSHIITYTQPQPLTQSHCHHDAATAIRSLALTRTCMRSALLPLAAGYEWNKYNQTHYDFDNPPPKVVQGYKFNILYHDLVDRTQVKGRGSVGVQVLRV
jgi:hypothetical protein